MMWRVAMVRQMPGSLLRLSDPVGGGADWLESCGGRPPETVRDMLVPYTIHLTLLITIASA